MRQTRFFSLVAATALGFAIVPGCVQEEPPPELPPVGTMQTELSSVASAPLAAKNGSPDADVDYSNFANAWVRVKLLQTYGTGIVFIPAVAMGLALTQEPTFRGGRWIWSVTVGESTGDLELSGSVVAGWDLEFLVTNATEGIDRYLWIEGHFDPSLTEGNWVGHDVNLPAGEDEVLEISWSYTSDTDRTLAFSNVNVASEDQGDVISYTVDGTTATVVFDDANDAELIANIDWDTIAGAGSIQVPYYNSGEKSCWDASFVNVACE